jgi:polyisoprenoid-binding protein YceI
MNFRMLSLLLSAMFFLFACTNAPDSDQAKTTEAQNVKSDSASNETWKISTADSKIEWIGTKVTGYHTGNIPLQDGDIFVNNGKVVGGKFAMNVKDMKVSGPKNVSEKDNAKLEGHLKSADFFDVEKYPDAKFELTDLQPYSGSMQDSADPRQEEINEYKVANPTHIVKGNLTMKGVTKNIEFPAQITVIGDKADAMAKFNINRKDWGIVYAGKPDDLIRDQIHLGIHIVAQK